MVQRLNYYAGSPARMKTLGVVHGHVRQSGLPARLIDLVYLRVSQINGCAYCIAIGLMNVYNRVAISFRAAPPTPAPRSHGPGVSRQ